MYSIGVISNNIELINLINQYGRITIIRKENIKRYLKNDFDILIIEENIIDEKEIEILCNHSKYILVYDILDLKISLEKDCNIITYGFNYKSTVTISSVNNSDVAICIQRYIKNINNKAIEQQEIIIENVDENDINNKIIKKIIQEILDK